MLGCLRLLIMLQVICNNVRYVTREFNPYRISRKPLSPPFRKPIFSKAHLFESPSFRIFRNFKVHLFEFFESLQVHKFIAAMFNPVHRKNAAVLSKPHFISLNANTHLTKVSGQFNDRFPFRTKTNSGW